LSDKLNLYFLLKRVHLILKIFNL